MTVYEIENKKLKQTFIDGAFKAIFSRDHNRRELFRVLTQDDDPGEITDITLTDDGMSRRAYNDLGLMGSKGRGILVELQQYPDKGISNRIAMYRMYTRMKYYNEEKARGIKIKDMKYPAVRAFVLYNKVSNPPKEIRWSKDSIIDGMRTDEEFTATVIDIGAMHREWKRRRDEGEDPETNILIDFVRFTVLYDEFKERLKAGDPVSIGEFIQKCKDENLFVADLDYLLMMCRDNMKEFYEMFTDEDMIADMRDAFLEEGREEGIGIGMEKGIGIGREEGREEGRAEGREEGRGERDNEIALTMLKRGYSIQDIASITGLPAETIERMRKDMSQRSQNLQKFGMRHGCLFPCRARNDKRIPIDGKTEPVHCPSQIFHPTVIMKQMIYHRGLHRPTDGQNRERRSFNRWLHTHTRRE